VSGYFADPDVTPEESAAALDRLAAKHGVTAEVAAIREAGQNGAMDLVSFLRARLDEDEQAAKLVPQPYRLYVSAEGRVDEPLEDEEHGGYRQWPHGEDWMPDHITNWSLIYDPARVLAEVGAKRQIVELEICLACHVESQPCDHRDATLRLLALPYADHPDYRQEWRP